MGNYANFGGFGEVHREIFYFGKTAIAVGLGLEDVFSPEAYDLLCTKIVMPEDTEELALTLNGRKRKIQKADFITKPWDNDELIRTLKDAIDRSQEVETLESIESTHIHKVVDQCHGNISRAAELLGITRQTLYAKLKR